MYYCEPSLNWPPIGLGNVVIIKKWSIYLEHLLQQWHGTALRTCSFICIVSNQNIVCFYSKVCNLWHSYMIGLFWCLWYNPCFVLILFFYLLDTKYNILEFNIIHEIYIWSSFIYTLNSSHLAVMICNENVHLQCYNITSVSHRCDRFHDSVLSFKKESTYLTLIRCIHYNWQNKLQRY